MSYISELFKNLNELTRYAPGVDGVSSLSDLEASARSARKRVAAVITAAVYDAVVASADEDLLDALRMAMANMTLQVQMTFDSINRRKNGTDVYKYELDGMRRSYMENYYNAMDSLISTVLDSDAAAVKEAWEGSRYATLLGGCPIKSAGEFDSIYNIDNSCLFFFRTLPIQKEVMDSRLGVYFSKVAGLDEKERLGSMLRLALAKKVVAIALRRFDILECPATIRNLFDESRVSGQRKDEREGAVSLANLLDGEVESLISDIDVLISADSNIDISSMSAYNRPEDNIIMMP